MRQLGQQVIELEDHAELAVPQRVAGRGRQIVDPPAVVVDFALVGRVERAQQVQQRALARAALADDRQELARGERSRLTPRSTGTSIAPLR